MKINGIYWGNPNLSSIDNVLDQFSGSKINSIKTSSVPLAQYWHKTEDALEELSKHLSIPLNNANLYFEYPTRSFGKNKSSMTDLMIISSEVKIAIEAKYTEYLKNKYELISSWYSGKNKTENRKKVLDHWIDILEPFCQLDKGNIDKIPYQFLHRSASACYENNGNAVVLYQLFYDKETFSKLEDFISLLESSKKLINPNNRLRYLIHKIEIKNISSVDESDVFEMIKTKAIYKFGKKHIIQL